MKALSIFLSFCVGFLSLSQEILWVRLVSFSQHGRPQAFSIVLTAFLIGIALGAIAGKKICQREPDLPRAATRLLLQAAALDLLCLYIAAAALTYAPFQLMGLFGLIAMSAMFKGMLFPLVHHMGSQAATERVGRSVSHVYMANVLGAALGPLVTGFVLLDRVSVERSFALIACAGAVLALITLLATRSRAKNWWIPAVLFCGLTAYVASAPPPVIHDLLAADGSTIEHIIQNKHGIIHVKSSDGEPGGDVTYGNNMYDGKISTDLHINSNRLDRAYLMAVMHPKPKRVLVIGLSSGAWTRVIAGLPDVEHIDVIEINPAYLELIGRYEEFSGLLKDPRINIHIDDGRRWLRAHPQARYDLVFMNSTFHWRAYMTLLLSGEFMQQVSGHLNTGGIFAMNTTGSADVFFTAQQNFKHVVRYSNFAYMSQMPLQKRADAEQVLRQARLGSLPAFSAELFDEKSLGHRLTHDRLESAAEFLANEARNPAPAAIHDQNLLTEFRHGRQPLFGLLENWLPATPHKD